MNVWSNGDVCKKNKKVLVRGSLFYEVKYFGYYLN